MIKFMYQDEIETKNRQKTFVYLSVINNDYIDDEIYV